MTAGISNTNLKAILIDLDGTMFDTAPEIAVAMNQTLQALNFRSLSFNTIRKFIGKKLRESLARFRNLTK